MACGHGFLHNVESRAWGPFKNDVPAFTRTRVQTLQDTDPHFHCSVYTNPGTDTSLKFSVYMNPVAKLTAMGCHRFCDVFILFCFDFVFIIPMISVAMTSAILSGLSVH